MRVALIDTTRKAATYPIALLRIGAWLKAQGHEPVYLGRKVPTAEDRFDEAWLTTLFTYDIPRAIEMARRCRDLGLKVKVGGISATLLPQHFERAGFEVHRGMMPEVEGIAPDYTLLPTVPKHSITHMTRGCVRNCKFCMVRKLEPKFKRRRSWVNDIHPEAKYIQFYDNNVLGMSVRSLAEEFAKLRKLVDAGQVHGVDFNQALDARLLTEEKADILATVPHHPMRFAFDSLEADGHFQNAVTMMAKRGVNEFINLALYNFKDTPEEFYYRMRECCRLMEDLNVMVKAFPMRYQPIENVNPRRNYIGEHWTEHTRRSIQRLLSSASGGSGVVFMLLPEFEYWFGRSPEEFHRRLRYHHSVEFFHGLAAEARLERARRGMRKTGKHTGTRDENWQTRCDMYADLMERQHGSP